jgi:hypothetical protein
VPEAVCIEFTAAGAPGVGNVVARAGAESSCEVAVIEWIATDVSDVFAIEGEITFDADAVRYGGFDLTGSVLSADGVQLVAIVNEVEQGRLTLGISRQAATGIDVSGSRLVVKLAFISNFLAGTTSTISVTDDCLLGSEDPPVAKDLGCLGGTLTIN